MTVQPSPWGYHHRRMHASTPTASRIQPSVKTILDLARECEQHIVRLYYLPTPGTNGFTTTHTLVFPPLESESNLVTVSNSTATPLSRSRSSSNSGHHHDPIQAQEASAVHPKNSTMHSRRIWHLTRSSESDRRVMYLARLCISSLTITTSSLPFLSQMVSLRLQGNRLTDLPLQIFRLPSLRELDVSQNLLTELSPLIGLLAPTLEELFLQSNRLQSLPQQLGQMKRLRLLDIADNHLGCIPVEVQRLVSESFASERRSMWRLNESSLSLNNTHSGNDDLQPFHIGDGPHSSTLQSPAEQHLGGHGGGGTLNITPNEDGGHDDDDYVQIRHGMKCWARGNKFWQVKASAASTSTSAPGSTPLSPITTTTTMLLAGSTQPSGAMSPPLRSPTVMDDMAIGLDHRPTGSMSSTSAIQASSMTPLSISSGSSSRNDDGHPLFETHGLFDRHHSRSYARHPQRQNSHSQPHPEHLVDRRGYCKDSYTSCSWTLSLVDICSQIVGEKLHDDPHYFCHRDSCPFKKDSLRLVSGTLSPSPQQPPLSSPRKVPGHRDEATSGYDLLGEDAIDGCTVVMIPDGMIEQLGLHRISELRKTLHASSMDDSTGDGFEHGDNTAGMDHTDPGYGSFDNGFSGFRNRSGRRALLDLPAPMELTLDEKEMESEYCSVCQKRLYFAGMRWKGVGVMDERIVPLEWAACSVQCRALAERGERRDHHPHHLQQQQQQQQQDRRQLHRGVFRDFPGTPSRDSGSTTGDSDYEGDEVVARAHGDDNGGQEGSFQSGVHTRVNQEGQFMSPAISPAVIGQLLQQQQQQEQRQAELPAPSGSDIRTETVTRYGEGDRDRHSPQRNYREGVVYGLLKTSALRRRTRALSL